MAHSAMAQRRSMGKQERRNTLVALLIPGAELHRIHHLHHDPGGLLRRVAFLDWGGGGAQIKFVGLDNFRTIFKDFSFTRSSNLGIALKNTVFYTIATVPLTIACSLGLALVLNKAVKGANFFRAVFFFPYVASLVAICVCWNFLLMKTGPVNQFLNAIGFNMTKSWTSSRDLAIWAIIIVSVWRNAGYYMVMYLAGLQGVPNELYEAATMDGANGWQKFTKVTIPMLTPTTFFCTIMMGHLLLQDLRRRRDHDPGLGPGRATKMLVTYIFELSFGGEGIATSAQYGLASAVSMVLFVIVLTVTFVQFRAEKKWVNYM